MKLSIITVSYQNTDELSATYSSVVANIRGLDVDAQANVEHLIVDGGTPGFDPSHYPHSISISEPDNGPFDAMNKGLAMARGEYVIFLNSGDRFFENVCLTDVIPALIGTVEIVAGNALISGFGTSRISSLSPYVCHQAAFIPRRALQPGFDANLRFYGDLDMWYRLEQAGNFHVRRLNRVICAFSLGGIGNNPRYTIQRLKEKAMVRKRHGLRPITLTMVIRALIEVPASQLPISAYYKLMVSLEALR